MGCGRTNEITTPEKGVDYSEYYCRNYAEKFPGAGPVNDGYSQAKIAKPILPILPSTRTIY
jgi:hypothetical protein